MPTIKGEFHLGNSNVLHDCCRVVLDMVLNAWRIIRTLNELLSAGKELNGINIGSFIADSYNTHLILIPNWTQSNGNPGPAKVKKSSLTLVHLLLEHDGSSVALCIFFDNLNPS